jgi:hypothetical protein
MAVTALVWGALYHTCFLFYSSDRLSFLFLCTWLVVSALSQLIECF